MKAVMSPVPPGMLEHRRITGADKFDEMWEGVLHMMASPNESHQELEWALETWLRNHWRPHSGGKVYHQRNVASPGGWPNDYRIPDLVLMLPEVFEIECDAYLDGAPSVVVEIRSPDDETYEKFPFYAHLGVAEIWVIDRDTKEPAIHTLTPAGYETIDPDAAGRLTSAVTNIHLSQVSTGQLEIQLAADDSTRTILPEE